MFVVVSMNIFHGFIVLMYVQSGQKGIGFKSVFRITDSPEIHSNGFHIRFDVNSGPLGYILPHWLDTDEQLSTDEYVDELIQQLH